MKTFDEQMADFDSRRARAGISDTAIAEESGIARSAISRYRHGQQMPFVHTWVDLNNALDRLIERRVAELTSLAS